MQFWNVKAQGTRYTVCTPVRIRSNLGRRRRRRLLFLLFFFFFFLKSAEINDRSTKLFVYDGIYECIYFAHDLREFSVYSAGSTHETRFKQHVSFQIIYMENTNTSRNGAGVRKSWLQETTTTGSTRRKQ
jgi:hypothetical protein